MVCQMSLYDETSKTYRCNNSSKVDEEGKEALFDGITRTDKGGVRAAHFIGIHPNAVVQGSEYQHQPFRINVNSCIL